MSRCSKCEGIILADTEDWQRPLCCECWEELGEPSKEPHGRFIPCRGCPTVQCTCFTELEEELLDKLNSKPKPQSRKGAE